MSSSNAHTFRLCVLCAGCVLCVCVCAVRALCAHHPAQYADEGKVRLSVEPVADRLWRISFCKGGFPLIYLKLHCHSIVKLAINKQRENSKTWLGRVNITLICYSYETLAGYQAHSMLKKVLQLRYFVAFTQSPQYKVFVGHTTNHVVKRRIYTHVRAFSVQEPTIKIADVETVLLRYFVNKHCMHCKSTSKTVRRSPAPELQFFIFLHQPRL